MAFMPSKSEFANTSGLTDKAAAIFSSDVGFGFLPPLS
jgi:hypothetical protein